MIRIEQSVGVGGVNDVADVAIVQELINNALSRRASVYRLLEVNGKIGAETISAILYVQDVVVHLRRPDGLVEPEGLTLRVLRKLMPLAPAATRPAKKPTDRIVKLRKRARPVLSEYTMRILRFAMAVADIDRMDISSTHRLVSDQARIMFNDNDSARQKGVTVRAVRGYGYGRAGTAVDQVYTAQQKAGKSADEIKKAMADEISSWLTKGVRTSKHCVEKSAYARNNILDIPYSGVVPASKKDELEGVLISIADSFNKRKYSEAGQKELENLHKHKLIHKVLVERKCWHLEIPQDAKKIPEI